MSSTGSPPEGDVNKGPAVVIAISVMITVTLIVVALRWPARLWITRNVWWDDWTILFAMVRPTLTALQEQTLTSDVGGQHHRYRLGLCGVHYGLGRSDHYLTTWQIVEFRKYTFGEWIQTFATLMWTKISICLFLMRIPISKALIRPL